MRSIRSGYTTALGQLADGVEHRGGGSYGFVVTGQQAVIALAYPGVELVRHLCSAFVHRLAGAEVLPDVLAADVDQECNRRGADRAAQDDLILARRSIVWMPLNRDLGQQLGNLRPCPTFDRLSPCPIFIHICVEYVLGSLVGQHCG